MQVGKDYFGDTDFSFLKLTGPSNREGSLLDSQKRTNTSIWLQGDCAYILKFFVIVHIHVDSMPKLNPLYLNTKKTFLPNLP